jgi:hypothetical protein
VTESHDDHEAEAEADIEAPPPIFGTWKRLYALVLLNLVLLIALLYVFRKVFE